jgi:LysR family hydrogen peroxide-inducible transcriptional activator
VAEHARRILHACEEAAAELARHGEAGRQILRIGCGPQTSLKFAPYLLRAYLCSRPNTDARLSVGNDQTLLHDLRVGLLDAVLLSLPVDDPELVAEPLWRYEMVFVVPRFNPTSATGKVRLEELAESPFLLFTRPVVTDLAIRELCSAGGIEPNIVIESEDPGFIREAVRLGLGFAVLPYWIVAQEARRGLVRVLRTRERIYYSYGVIWRRQAPLPRALAEFAEVARQWRQWWPLAHYVVPLEPREEPSSHAAAG